MLEPACRSRPYFYLIFYCTYAFTVNQIMVVTIAPYGGRQISCRMKIDLVVFPIFTTPLKIHIMCNLNILSILKIAQLSLKKFSNEFSEI